MIKKPPSNFLFKLNIQGKSDFGNINIIYNINQGSNELAKGTFYTFLAKDDKANSPYYKVEGTFDLQLK